MAIARNENRFILLALAFSIVVWAVVRYTPVTLARAQSQAVPFTLVQAISLETSGEVDKKTAARRSDGTLVEVGAAGPPGYGMRFRSVIFPDASQTVYYDAFRMKTTWPKRRVGASSDQPNFHPTTCGHGSAKLISRDRIFGEDVEVIDETSPDFHMISYQAPRLACYTLKYEVLIGPPNKASGNVVSLDVGKEPSPDLFTAPADYEEVRPSEADKRLLVAIGYGEHLTDPEHIKSSAEMDALYDARHQQK